MLGLQIGVLLQNLLDRDPLTARPGGGHCLNLVRNPRAARTAERLCVLRFAFP